MPLSYLRRMARTWPSVRSVVRFAVIGGVDLLASAVSGARRAAVGLMGATVWEGFHRSKPPVML